MKKYSAVSLLVFAAVMFWAVSCVVPAPASADIVFELVNNSGRTFREIWVGPSSNSKWLNRDKFVNRNGSPTRLASGRSLTLWPNMSGREDVRYWDIKVYTNDGKKHEWHDIDLVKYYQVEIDRRYTAHFSR